MKYKNYNKNNNALLKKLIDLILKTAIQIKNALNKRNKAK